MSWPYTFHYAIIGTDTTFCVTLNDTHSVYDLKEQVKAKKQQTLASVTLTPTPSSCLKSRSTYPKRRPTESDRRNISRMLSTAVLGFALQVIGHIQGTNLPEMIIHILVRLPTDVSMISGVCSPIAETLLYTAKPCSASQRSKLYIYVDL